MPDSSSPDSEEPLGESASAGGRRIGWFSRRNLIGWLFCLAAYQADVIHPKRVLTLIFAKGETVADNLDEIDFGRTPIVSPFCQSEVGPQESVLLPVSNALSCGCNVDLKRRG